MSAARCSRALRRSRLACVAAALCTAPALAQIHSAPPGSGDHSSEPRLSEAPYRSLDNEEGPWIDLLMPPIRPLARNANLERIYAVNVNCNRVVEASTGGTVLRTFDVPWGPVSVATFRQADTLDDFLLVVCRGNHVLVRIDLKAGVIDRVIALSSEPADVRVHPESGHAWVSCSGVDVVVQVDVEAGRVLREVPIPSKQPTFLTFVGGELYVAPMLSGNNSLVQTGEARFTAGPDGILDLEDPTVAVQGLPDEDLFRIEGGAAVPVATDTGTVLCAVDVNPATGALWQLATEALNKDPERIGEAALRGAFLQNRMSILQLSAGQTVEPMRVIDLDDSQPLVPGVQIDVERAVGQPYALAFDDAGRGYVTGLLSDNVTQLDSLGGFVREWNVGSMPRGVLVDEAGERAWVHCSGSNEVELYDLQASAPQLIAVVDLGFDPTPEREALGRRLFFEGANSRSGNVACSSCHIEGGSDLLAWDLSDLPTDDKGPLTTQTLVGIDDMARFHWRGERTELSDFNPAFDKLLGGSQLDPGPGGEFEALEAFLFSLRQPANPNQDPRRIVNASFGFTTPDGVFHPGDAVRGQADFFTKGADGGPACIACHPMPTGGPGDTLLGDRDSENPRRNVFDVPAFVGHWRKHQPTLVEVVFADGLVEDRTTLGAAFVSTGLADSILEVAEAADVSAFVTQLDSGLAPAVHRAYLLASAESGWALHQLATYLLPQARERNCDVVVFGTVDFGAGAVARRWYWERKTERFVSEFASDLPVTLDFFVAQTQAGLGRNVFLGVPVGMGQGVAVDFDRDELFNGDEVALGTDPYDSDSDDDGDPDGHEVTEGGDPSNPAVTSDDQTPPVIADLRLVHANVSVAKLQLETSEPARLLTSWTTAGASGSEVNSEFRKVHEVVLHDLVPGQHYDVLVRAVDLGDNQSAASLDGGFDTLDFLLPEAAILEELAAAVLTDSGGTLRLRVSGRAVFKRGGTIAGRRLEVQAFVNDAVLAESLFGTLSEDDGLSTVEVVANGLAPGDELRVSVFSVYDDAEETRAFWDMASTAPEDRELAVTYSGTGS